VEVALDERGRVYYLALEEGAPPPTSLQIRHPDIYAQSDNAKWRPELAAANRTVPGGGIILEMVGLPSETPVAVYLVAEDMGGGGGGRGKVNLMATPVKLSAVTADITPPDFLSPYPLVPPLDLAGTELVVQVALNEPGFVYYVVLEAGDGANPTPEEVRVAAPSGGRRQVAAGSAAVAQEAAGGRAEGSVRVTGLTPGAKYDVFVTAEDDDHEGDNGRNLRPQVVRFKVPCANSLLIHSGGRRPRRRQRPQFEASSGAFQSPVC
jgi:hypothetical protein